MSAKKFTSYIIPGIVFVLGIFSLTGTTCGCGPGVEDLTPVPTPSPTTQMGVYSGYTGSLDWTITDSAGPGVGVGGDVGGGDGAGGCA